MIKTLFASVAAVAATMVLSVGVAAGATVMHFNLNTPQQCFVKGPYTYCVTTAGEETVVQAPSGNFSGDINATDSFAITNNGTVFFAGTDSIHEHVLYASDFTVLKEGGIHQTSTSTDGIITCTFSADVHATGLNLITGTGHLQYTNVSFVCA